MIKVIIESPYAGEVRDNLEYARLCVKDSLDKGEAPLASHLLYTQPGILDDFNQAERDKGIEAGLTWMKSADKVIYYIDNGMSIGMKYSLLYAKLLEKKIEYRKLNDGMKEATHYYSYTYPNVPFIFKYDKISGLLQYDFESLAWIKASEANLHKFSMKDSDIKRMPTEEIDRDLILAFFKSQRENK